MTTSPPRPAPRAASVDTLLRRYSLFFLDAYGVLVHTGGALRGASEFLTAIRDAGKRFMLLSNDASRLPGTIAARYRSFGLPVDEPVVCSSGMLIAPYFAEEHLAGKGCIVLGPTESGTFVTQAGGVVTGFDDASAEVVVVADEAGFDFLDGIERVLTTICQRLDRGAPVHLVVCNPDLVFPRSVRTYGLGIGTVGLWLEQALAVRYPDGALSAAGFRAARLGKPETRLFRFAASRLDAPMDLDGTVMIGDQIPTDIAGAAAFGIDSVLIGTGLTRLPTRWEAAAVTPTWILETLAG